MIMKMLYITNLATKIGGFSLASINASREQNIGFHIAANFNSASKKQIDEDQKTYGVSIHHIDINRSPFSLENLKAYRQIVELIKKENIDYIHCNTPVGGILGRLAGKKCKVKKVIYQAHGFHFYKGAPKQNWIIYYPVEKWLARYTDMLITINREDYELAEAKMRLKKGGKVYYVPGVGIDAEKIRNMIFDRDAKRCELGIAPEQIALLSVGELNDNKNHETVIRAISCLRNDNIVYIICGKGEKEEKLKNLAGELGVNLILAGYRNDIAQIYKSCDMFVFPSKREGLSRSKMEAMAAGLPVICSDIRGNTDLINDGQGGFLCNPHDTKRFAEKIDELSWNVELREKMKNINLENIKNFSIDVVNKKIQCIYEEALKEKNEN